MTEELTRKIVAWATEIASYAAELPSSRARDAYLAERRPELIAGAVAQGARQQDAVILADACVGAARRIMTELLAQRGIDSLPDVLVIFQELPRILAALADPVAFIAEP